MNAASRLALYGVGLVAIFVASYAAAGALAAGPACDQFNPRLIDGVDHFFQAIYNRSNNTVAGFHPLDGRQRDAR